jgi:hypothetical protein
MDGKGRFLFLFFTWSLSIKMPEGVSKLCSNSCLYDSKKWLVHVRKYKIVSRLGVEKKECGMAKRNGVNLNHHHLYFSPFSVR